MYSFLPQHNALLLDEALFDRKRRHIRLVEVSGPLGRCARVVHKGSGFETFGLECPGGNFSNPGKLSLSLASRARGLLAVTGSSARTWRKGSAANIFARGHYTISTKNRLPRFGPHKETGNSTSWSPRE